MICACELLRKEHEDLFGKNRITIGLWVGGTTTPNHMDGSEGAVKKFEKLKQDGKENPFVILKCPWCGAQMGAIQRGNIWEIAGYKKVMGPHGKAKIVFRCRNRNCDFSKEDLPLFVVDDAIYESTPTLLLGTVDKFAMLPFRPKAQCLFWL